MLRQALPARSTLEGGSQRWSATLPGSIPGSPKWYTPARMATLIGVVIGLAAWFALRILLMGFYTVDQNERAFKTRFGRAVRVPGDKTTLDDPIAEALRPEERERYTYPQV